MKVLIDTNVVLDVLLERDPHHDASSQVLAAVEKSLCEGCVCATTITTIHYIASRHIGNARALECIQKLTSFVEVAAVNQGVIEMACRSKFKDFEDAVLHAAAVQANAVCIVTRNVKDFKESKLLVYTPDQFISL